jgi:hypothetical protein
LTFLLVSGCVCVCAQNNDRFCVGTAPFAYGETQCRNNIKTLRLHLFHRSQLLLFLCQKRQLWVNVM